MVKTSKNSFYIAIFMLIFCIFFYLESLKIQQTEMVRSVNSAPIIWPKTLIIILFIFNLYTALKYFKKIITPEVIPTTNSFSISKIIELKENKLLMVIFFVGIYIFSVDYFGILIPSFLLTIVLMRIFGEKRLSTVIIYSVLLIILTGFIFLKILYVPLPRGMGIFRNFSQLFY